MSEATVPGIGVCESCGQEKKCEHPVDALVLKWMDHGEKRVLCSCGYDFGPVRELIKAKDLLAISERQVIKLLDEKYRIENECRPSPLESQLREANEQLKKQIRNLENSPDSMGVGRSGLRIEVGRLNAEVERLKAELARISASPAGALITALDAEIARLKDSQLAVDVSWANRLAKMAVELDEALEGKRINYDACAKVEKERDEARKERDELKAQFAPFERVEYWKSQVDELVKERNRLRDAGPDAWRHAHNDLLVALGITGDTTSMFWPACLKKVVSLREKADRMDDIIAITRQVGK